MNIPIEKMTTLDLLKEWHGELDALGAMEKANPTWVWKTVQLHLERLHALANEIRNKKAQESAKWQP